MISEEIELNRYLERHGEPDFEAGCPGHKVIASLGGSEVPQVAGWLAEAAPRASVAMRTDSPEGEKVTVTGAWDSEEEARLVCEEIESLQAKGHRSAGAHCHAWPASGESIQLSSPNNIKALA